MTAEILKTKSKEEVLNFIRERLSFGISSQIREDEPGEFNRTQHRRFEMSGYESVTGQNTLFNQAILNEFADLGIYNYTHYLVLDFFKGMPFIYLKYWNDVQNLEFDEFSGYTTSEIIYEIFKLTIFTNKTTRRRD